MEQHPIPQDVTGFQFKLIGTMTVKQFGYVAIGAILAVICWYVPAPGPWVMLSKFILLPIFGITGVIIAFVPIEGRPIDVMATNFFHALASPNQYVYIKKGRKFNFTQTTYAAVTPISPGDQKIKIQPKTNTESKKKQQLQLLLSNRYSNIKNNLDEKEVAFYKNIANTSMSNSTPSLQATSEKKIITHDPASNQRPTPAAQSQSLAHQEELLQQQLVIARQENSHQKMLSLQEQIQSMHSQKQQVEKELLKLKNQLSVQKPAIIPSAIKQPNLTTQDADMAHSQNTTKNTAFSHISDTPNVIIGIIKDARENILPNILVEVKDKDGNPVRAFKTNPLGQFASATPLTNGSYTIELEDPKKQHTFDIIQINANGQIMLPIEITSHDAREELRKALFN